MKQEQMTQTEWETEEKLKIPDFGILDKLPAFDNCQSKDQKKGKKVLDINIRNGVAGPCFRCKDLECKIMKVERGNDKLREEIKRYQKEMGSTAEKIVKTEERTTGK